MTHEDPTRMVPIDLGQMRFSLERSVRWNLCEKMKRVDPNVNFYGMRPLTGEFLNSADGNRTVAEIARNVGYEYGMTIRPEHVLEFFKIAVEEGAVKFREK